MKIVKYLLVLAIVFGISNMANAIESFGMQEKQPIGYWNLIDVNPTNQPFTWVVKYTDFTGKMWQGQTTFIPYVTPPNQPLGSKFVALQGPGPWTIKRFWVEDAYWPQAALRNGVWKSAVVGATLYKNGDANIGVSVGHIDLLYDTHPYQFHVITDPTE